MKFHSLSSKVTLVMVGISALGLSLSGLVFLLAHYFLLKDQARSSLESLAQIVAYNSASAVMFSDRESAGNTLKALDQVPDITGVRLRDGRGNVFAEYTGQGKGDDLTTRIPISDNGEAIGHLDMSSSMDSAWRSMRRAIPLVTLVGVVTLALIGWLAVLTSRRMIRPILGLAEVANQVGLEKNYALRAPPVATRDEAYQLTERFNEMLAQIEERDRELARYREHLEQQVAERTAALVEARDAAEAASRAKSDFLATMSHEIRTPLNGVIGMAEILAKTTLDEDQRRYLRIVRRSGEDLLAIINDILDFSKIEAGKLDLELAPFGVNQLLDDIAERFAPAAHGKGLEFLCASLLEGLTVIGDRNRLGQVLTNLAGNAIKFTEQGEIVLRAESVGGDGRRATLRFSVRDTGIGITEEQRQRLFLPFSQGDGSTTRRFGGTGLGLVISRRLVEMMNGSIGLHSAPGIGSEFYFTLTFEVGDSGPRKVHPEGLAGLKLLVVDDNRTNLEILASQLDSWHCRYELAAGAQQALGKFYGAVGADDPFNLLLTDLMMPGIDGAELITSLRSDPAFKDLPAIVLSSAGSGVPAGLPAGALRVLTKPVRQSNLYNALAEIVEADGAPVEVVAPARPRVERLRGRVLLVDDNLVNQEVAGAMLQNLGLSVEVAANGIDALELVQRKEYDAVLMDCHMPVMDGYEATREIRVLEARSGRYTPIVALTANAVAGDRDKCIAAGMDDYIAKPFSQGQLAVVLGYWLAGEPGRRAEPLNDAPAAPSAAAVIDHGALDALREMRADLLARVLDAWLGESPQLLREIHEGVQRRDGALFTRAAHTLKSSSQTVGAGRVHELAREVEIHGRTGGAWEELEALRGALDTAFREAEQALRRVREDLA